MPDFRFLVRWCLPLLFFLATALHGQGQGTVSVSPSTATVFMGGTQAFTATVTGAWRTAIVWSVQEAGGGTVDGLGTYTAPSTPGIYHVVATNYFDGATATATVTVPPILVSISPSTSSLAYGTSQQFTATVSGASDTYVIWTSDVPVGSSYGYMNGNGLFVAGSAAGTFQVVATSRADPTKSATATVTVVPPVIVLVSPTSANLGVGMSQALTATVSNAANPAVTWSTTGGTLSATTGNTVTWTAPGTLGSYTVTARSVADTSKTATATLSVIPVQVTVSPATATVPLGSTQSLSASVAGTANTAVTWTASAGSLSAASGSPVTWTPPSSAGTYSVTATSQAEPSKSATATLTVSSAVGITITPTTASLSTGASQTFTAGVTGTSNTAVTWSVLEAGGGSINASGLYTAPSTPGTYHVKVTSAADTSKSATATVTVSSSVVISIAPVIVSVQAGLTQTFSATVTGSANLNAVWTCSGGSLSSTLGTSTVWTAPATVGTYTVRATSQADGTQSATATVTVTAAPPVNVSVSPAQVSMTAGTAVSLAATVTNATDTSVTWTCTGGVLGTASGNSIPWTAPPIAGSYTVTATSVADPTKTASVTIRVNPAVCTPVN